MTLVDVPTVRIDAEGIEAALRRQGAPSCGEVREALAQARELRGLKPAQVAALMSVSDPDLLVELYAAARWVKEEIYGSRLVLFAPLYISNYCANECSYCAFRCRNAALKRRSLNPEEIAGEVKVLLDQGHKRLLLVAGESYPDREGLDYILKAIDTVYATRTEKGEIRRVNVNIAPLSVEDFRRLKARDIGTYQVFQETYHRPTYRQVHLAGVKKDFDWRVNAPGRAMQAGIDDVGVGVLFGLYDWKFEVLALLEHIRHLEETFGVGPHTISVPRLEPAVGSQLAAAPPHRVSDADFLKLVAGVAAGGAVYRDHHVHARKAPPSAARPLRWASRRSPAAAAPTPAAMPSWARKKWRRSSSSAITGRWTKWCAMWRASGTSPRSAPPATAWAAPEPISWIWPSRFDQGPLRAQRSGEFPGVPAGLCVAADEERRQGADRGEARGARSGYPAANRNDAAAAAPEQAGRVRLNEEREEHMLQATPKGFRLHIGLFGRRNVGKSSLLNALTRQQVSIVSDVAGTTTDPVEKPMELLPLGPVLFIDTAGVDDTGTVGALRVSKTRQVFDRTDLGVLVSAAGEWGDYERMILLELQSRQVPVVVVFNKCDVGRPEERLTQELAEKKARIVCTIATDGRGLLDLRQALLDSAPAELAGRQTILRDLVGPGELAVLVIPIDKEAPKGRIILPQVQAIRDLLDGHAMSLVTTDTELPQALAALKAPPKLVGDRFPGVRPGRRPRAGRRAADRLLHPILAPEGRSGQPGARSHGGGEPAPRRPRAGR